MFETGQQVVVITEKGIAYEATILAVARDDSGRAAYKVAQTATGVEQLGQWHKAGDIFIVDKAAFGN